jgi:WD40 repeat protein
MGLIFISHSSRDNTDAAAMRDWLAMQGWDEVFLDLDASTGLAPGQRWRDELRKAGERCSAVVVLISQHWAASKWCLTEFLFAAQLGKEIFPVLVAPCSLSELPVELTATYQFADISTAANRAEGLERLRLGLQRAGLHPGAFPWPPKDEPRRPIFRGLRVLEEQDAAIFFGRDVQITKALDAIRRMRDGAPERILAILGASGAGKSSFLRAGLLARLKRDTERFLVLPTVRPGRAALTGPTGLRQAFGLSGSLDRSILAARFAELRASVVERLRNHAPHRAPRGGATIPPTVILPIDQSEELFVAGDEEAPPAVALIVDAVRADPGVLLLVTIRSDSFGLLQGDRLLSSIPRLPFDLPRLPPAAFKEIIEGPTRLPSAGIEIDADLTELLIQDFDGADALPLLAFTLERVITDHGSDGRIERREYVDEMKGVGGAIRKAVEVAFARVAEIPGLPRSRADLDAIAQRTFVPGLVRIDDVAALPKRRVALRSQLPQEALPLIDCLVDQRLLVTDTAGAETTVEVSHEAVLRHWRELEGWIAERRDDLSLAERVMMAAREWRAVGGDAEQEALVHRGERLRAAERLLLWDELRRQMGDDTVAYLAACREAETRSEAAKAAQRRRQRRLRLWIGGLIAAAAIVTLLGAALVVTGQRNLVHAQSLTLARTAQRFAEQADYVRALRLSILAGRGNWLLPPSPEGRAGLSSNAQSLKLLTDMRGHDDMVVGAVFSNDAARVLTWSADGTARLWNAATGATMGPVLRHDELVWGAVFSKDESRILTWSADNTARIWNAATGVSIAPPLRHDDSVSGAVFSKDETRVLTWSEEDNTARLWNAATGAPIGPALKHHDSVLGAVFSKDETRILTWSEDNTARLWNAATGAPIGPVLKHDDSVLGAVFSKDETRILTWSEDNTARLWNTATGAPIGQPVMHQRSVLGAVFSQDEARILTWSEDNTTQLWSAATGLSIGPALTHGGAVLGAVFSKDETRILTWSEDNTARLWNAATGAPIGPALAHDGAVFGARFAPDEARILTWSLDQTARLWNAATASVLGPHGGSVKGAVFSKDEARILTWSEDNTARLWSAATGAAIGPALTHKGRVLGAAFSKDEDRILTWSADNTARLWNAATGAAIGPALTHGGMVVGAAFSGDAARILTWSLDRTVRLWNAATGAAIDTAFTHEGAILGAVFSKDASRVLTWNEKRARLWNVATAAPIGPALEHGGTVRNAVFSKDGDRILTWSTDGTARLWNAVTGAAFGQALRNDGAVLGAVFSNDASRVLTWGTEKTGRLWNAATGAAIGPVLTHEFATIGGAVFANDGSRILTWGGDKTARLWNTATGAAIGPALRHDSGVEGAVFSKDESRILTWSMDGTARLWNTATGAAIGPALRHDGVVFGAVFSKEEARILTWSLDKTARLWDVRWAMRDPGKADFVRDLCREKLVGQSVQAQATASPAPLFVGVRNIDMRDTEAAPILRGREGEDVCGSPPTAWQKLRSLVRLIRD